MSEVAQSHLDRAILINRIAKKIADNTVFAGEKAFQLKDGFKINNPISKIYIFGTGGTGGWFIPKLVKILNDASAKFLVNKVEVILVDGDIVELKNVARQNFIVDDVGTNKAEVMSDRYGPHLVNNMEMFFIDKFVGNKTIIEKYPEESRDKFINIDDLFSTVINDDTVLILNFIDNAITRKVIHAKAIAMGKDKKSKSNILIFDVANNSYNGQVNFSYYPALIGQENYFAPSNFFLNYPSHLSDLEGLKLENCADADVTTTDQLFNANDFAASLIGNSVNALIQDKSIKNGLIKFTTGNNVEVSTDYKLCNASNDIMMTVVNRTISEHYLNWNLSSEEIGIIERAIEAVKGQDDYKNILELNVCNDIVKYILDEFTSSFSKFNPK